jgi:hypothetical protein
MIETTNVRGQIAWISWCQMQDTNSTLHIVCIIAGIRPAAAGSSEGSEGSELTTNIVIVKTYKPHV